MLPANRHAMILEHTHPTGVEEWACPTCGRRFVAQWAPAIKRLILSAGDEAVIHTGGGMTLTAHATPSDARELAEEDPAQTVDLDRIWHDWLQALDFGEDDPDHPDNG